ncbi:MAG: LysR family transcriptional regulator [Actinomycetes bacterium]
MNLQDLRTFVAVVEHGGFGRAAAALHVAQPAVSQHVKRLERELGATVLRRSTRRVELTAAGAQLLRRARSIVAEVDRAEGEVRLIEAGRAGRVALGFVGTATYDLMPKVARRVRQHLPDVELDLHGERLSPALVAALLARDLDVVAIRDPDPDPALRVRHLRAERLVAVLPADHPGAGEDEVALADLRGERFVTHPSGHRSVMFAAVMDACQRAGFLPEEVVEVRETAALVAFVAAGTGVALVPEPVRSLALEGVVFRPLSDVDQRTDLVLATRADETSATVLRVAGLVEA